MAAVSLLWKTNMAVITSRRNEAFYTFFDFLGGAFVGAPANQSQSCCGGNSSDFTWTIFKVTLQCFSSNGPLKREGFVFPMQLTSCSRPFSFCLFFIHAYICTCRKWNFRRKFTLWYHHVVHVVFIGKQWPCVHQRFFRSLIEWQPEIAWKQFLFQC